MKRNGEELATDPIFVRGIDATFVFFGTTVDLGEALHFVDDSKRSQYWA